MYLRIQLLPSYLICIVVIYLLSIFYMRIFSTLNLTRKLCEIWSVHIFYQKQNFIVMHSVCRGYGDRQLIYNKSEAHYCFYSFILRYMVSIQDQIDRSIPQCVVPVAIQLILNTSTCVYCMVRLR